MKKIFALGIIAFAALSVSSCAKDEVVSSLPEGNAITFGTYLGQDVESRGEELTNTNFSNFGVFAFYTGQAPWSATATPNFMYNQLVEKSGTAWVYSPLKYWPTTKGDKISFFAYAPHTTDATTGVAVKSANNAAAAPVITYTITNADLETQADFVTDVLVDEIKAGDGSTLDDADRTVAFVLRHELTRVAIYAKLDRDAFGTGANQTQVNIKSVKLNGAQCWTVADYTFGTADNATGTWAPTTAGEINIANLLNINTSVSLGGYTTSGILLPNTTAVSLFKADQYLLLIPHGTTGLVSDGAVQMEVAYDIVTVDASLAAGHSVTSATKVINLPAGLLKQGVAYQLNLTFGLNEIVLSATVDAWDTASDDENVDWPKTDVLP